MGVAAKLDELGKPAWIVLTVLALIAWWPLGLAILGYLVWSGRMSFGMRGNGFEMGRGRGRRGCGWARGHAGSGNRAFDEYREETLRRLEEEERAFRDFLDRLRMAKDRAEFDQFMAERRRDPGEAASPAA
jgi:hypothetical protein